MNKFLESLQELLTDRKITRYQLSKEIGVNNATISSYFYLGNLPELKTAKKIADYFSVSLDFLFGRTDNPKKIKVNNLSFIQNLENIIKQNRLSVAKLMREIEVSERSFYRWKNGDFPTTAHIVKIADYLDLSVDELVGSSALY